MTIMVMMMKMFVCEKEVCLLCAGSEEQCERDLRESVVVSSREPRELTSRAESDICLLSVRLPLCLFRCLSVARNIRIPYGAKACG